MFYTDPHPSDQDLLLAADGELPESRQSEIQGHLKACWSCRCRMAEVERTISKFVGSYHALLDPQLSEGNGSDSLLKARLNQDGAVSKPSRPPWRWLLPAASVFVAVLIGGALLSQKKTQPSGLDAGTIPDARLTPGEALPVSRNDVCQSDQLGENQEVPAALREAVFAAYGMKASQSAYEVDFLITPALGGSANIRNLWPEPYHSRTWNAYRKDVLEERLHALVCSGQVDLATAQREIAANWVAAYKKYVGSDNAAWFSAEQRR